MEVATHGDLKQYLKTKGNANTNSSNSTYCPTFEMSLINQITEGVLAVQTLNVSKHLLPKKITYIYIGILFFIFAVFFNGL